MTIKESSVGPDLGIYPYAMFDPSICLYNLGYIKLVIYKHTWLGLLSMLPYIQISVMITWLISITVNITLDHPVVYAGFELSWCVDSPSPGCRLRMPCFSCLIVPPCVPISSSNFELTSGIRWDFVGFFAHLPLSSSFVSWFSWFIDILVLVPCFLVHYLVYISWFSIPGILYTSLFVILIFLVSWINGFDSFLNPG